MSRILAARWPVAITVIAILLLAALAGAAMGWIVIVAGEGDPQVTTDKSSYGADELVTITGTGFGSGQILDVPVVRPDDTIVTGDGTDTPGFDTVIADAAGDFTYYYQLAGYASGIYTVEVYDNSDTGHLTLLASTTFLDGRITSLTLKYRNFTFGSTVDVTLTQKTQYAHLNPHDPVPPPNNEHKLSGVAADGAFTVEVDDPFPSGNPRLGPMTKLELDNGSTTIEIPIHTSCSAPIGVGFIYGADGDGFADGPFSADTSDDFDPPLTAGLEIAALTSFDCGERVPSITICKDADPDDAQDFSFTGDLDTFSLDDDSDGTLPNCKLFSNLDDDTSYSISETVPGGWDLTNIICSGDPDVLIGSDGDFDPGDTQVTIDLDTAEDVTCTITNTAIAPTLTLVKNVVNDDGGTLVVGDFPLFIDGNPVTSGVANTVSAGVRTASETPQPGYAASDWGTDCAAGGTVSLAPGESKTCTITNNDIAPTLTLIKEVVNDDGGTLVVGDFPLFIDGNPVTSGVATTVSVGVRTASETPQPGYAASDWGTDCATDGTITLAPGESKTCTITNNDIAPTLTLIKEVVNDDGGTLVVGDFPLFIDGNPVTSGVATTVSVGVRTASETPQPGYAASDWGTDCAAGGTVSLAPGESKTCTITNNDIAPTLTLIKEVVNDDGGTLVVGDFPLFIDGNPVTSGVANTVSVGVRTASETPQPGYAASDWGTDCATDGTITLAPGESKTCTITNNDIAPTLTLIKEVVNDDGGTLVVGDFPLFIDGNPVTSGVATTVSVGVRTASETPQPGYAASDWGTDCATDGTITLAPGESKTCTITNNDIAPTLTLIKEVVNDDGGTLVVGDFPLFIDGNPVTSGVANTVSVGVRTASETPQPGYAASDWGTDCAAGGTVSLAPGESKTCTITNNDIAPTLTLIKEVVNDDGGTLVVGDFPLFIDGNPVTSGVANTVSVGVRTASETPQPGYAASDWGTDCAAGGTVSLAPGESKTCTITNNDIAPTLTLIKEVVNDDGGTLVVGDFPLFIDGNPVTSGVANTVSVGVRTASETPQPGYAASDWGTDCAAGGTVSLAPGESKTCTITNNDIAPTLTLIKEVVNDDGGTLVVGDFPLFIDGNPVTSGVANTVSVGVRTASETPQPGYAASDWGTDCATDGTITLAPGESKTCTITNNDIAPTLTLIKEVVNDDGGTLVVGDFPLFIDGNPVTSGVATTVSVGAHTASETPQSGYAASDWGTDCATDGTITLALGESKTCTITNDDIAPTLTLVKNVVNDDGGTLVVGDFPLFIDGNPVTSGVATTVSAGAHTASETPQPGYAASDWGTDCAAGGTVSLAPGESKTCTITNDDITQPQLTLVKNVVNDDGGTLVVGDFPLFIDGNPVTSGVATTVSVGAHTASETPQSGYAASDWGTDCATDGTITLALGESKTCTITNNDIAPTLTLVKNVVNDDGGTLVVGDFPLFIDGNPVTSGVATTVSAGAHTASETPQPGYAASDWGTDCAAGGTVSLAPGESKTCTITNDDIAPQLTLVKNVVNDDGGTLLVGDFPLFIDGNPVTSGVANTVSAGVRTASETPQPGYAASDWGTDCATDGTITLALGESKTCTITNNDIAPTLTLVKNVINDDGGTLVVGDFPLFIDGNPVTSGVATTVSAGAHTASETPQPGYAASDWGTDCAADGTVSLALGESKTCTITNDDITQPQLTLVKNVINDDGGTLVVGDFPLFIDGNPVTSGVATTVSAGAHTASETPQPGYAASDWGTDCAADGTVSLALGESKTCTITNDDVPAGEPEPAISLVKSANPSIIDPGDPVTFTYTVTNTGSTYVSVYKLEDSVYGDITGSASCSPTLPALLAPTESVSCTYTADPGPSTDQTNIGTATADPTDDQGTPLPGVDDVQASDDAFVNVGPPPVGGIVEVRVARANLSAQQSNSAAGDHTTPAMALAAGVVAVAAGALYARRRWLE